MKRLGWFHCSVVPFHQFHVPFILAYHAAQFILLAHALLFGQPCILLDSRLVFDLAELLLCFDPRRDDNFRAFGARQ